MADVSILAGTTSYTRNVFIGDSSVTTGAGKTGITYNSSGIKASYSRAGAAAVAITLATQTAAGAYSSGGFVEIDATNMPGWYRFDIPNAAIAASAKSVDICIFGVANCCPVNLSIELTATDNQNAVTGGLSALPNAAAAASGGLLINGSNTGTVTLAAFTCTGAFTVSGGMKLTVSSTTLGALDISNTSAVGGGSGIKIACTSATSGSSTHGINISTNYGSAINAITTILAVPAISVSSSAGDAISAIGGVSGLSLQGGFACINMLGTGRGITVSTTREALSLSTTGAYSVVNVTPSNGYGVKIAGASTYAGLRIESGAGATGDAVSIVSTTTNGNGISFTGSGTGSGILAKSGAGASGDAVAFTAQSTAGNGFTITGSGTGHGLAVKSGTGVTGDAINLVAQGTRGHGLSSTGAGADEGIGAYGGATGAGLICQGGATSGNGITALGGGSGVSISGTVTAVTNAVTLPAMPTDWISSAGMSAAAVTKIQSGLATPTNITAATGVSLAASQHVIVDSGTVTTLTNLPAVTTDWLTAAGVKADAVTKIQAGLATGPSVSAIPTNP